MPPRFLSVATSGAVLAADETRALIERIRGGDEVAFEMLFRATYDGLYAAVYRLVLSGTIAEELVQDLFVAIWADRAQWDPGDSMERVRKYLFLAARRRALNAMRRARLEQRWLGAEPLVGPTAEAADAVAERAARVRAVREAVARLPERGRIVMLLQWQRGMTYPEIAECLGISVKTVEVHVSRSLKALRRMLQDVDRTSM